jgi:hypothetical protein
VRLTSSTPVVLLALLALFCAVPAEQIAKTHPNSFAGYAFDVRIGRGKFIWVELHFTGRNHLTAGQQRDCC